MRILKSLLALLLCLDILSANAAVATCQGNFVNPITDICWDCMFPVAIGGMTVVPGAYHSNIPTSSPVCLCKTDTLPRVGITFSYWEPFALEDVTATPMCMVNMGGISLPIPGLENDMGGEGNALNNSSEDPNPFYWVHYYQYPLLYWLNIITDVGCMDTGNFDIAYLTELDPTWNNDLLGFVLNPEAVLFGNPIAQASCVADAAAATLKHPIDAMFWCMGAQGSAYPLTGNIAGTSSTISGSVLEGERMNYKLHREGLLWDTWANNLCQPLPSPILPKSHYAYQMVNTVPDALSCHSYGDTSILWESGHDNPMEHGNFGYLIWRERNCCFL